MAVRKTTDPASINFHFDPLCPLAWRTALWIREVRNVRPVNVTWRFFSLEVVNRKEGVEPDYVNGSGWLDCAHWHWYAGREVTRQ